MKRFHQIFKQILKFLTKDNIRTLRAKELSAWTELQIATQLTQESSTQEQEKISQLIVHHTRQMSHLIFSIEDVISNEQQEKQDQQKQIMHEPIISESNNNFSNHNSELKATIREIKTTLQFLQNIFTINENQKIKKTIPSKIKEIEVSIHSLDKSSNSFKQIHKSALQNQNQRSAWQNYIVSLLEEFYRLQTTLSSMKNILLQSRQGRFGPLLETAETLKEIVIHQESLQTEIKSIQSRLSSAIQNRKDLEIELQSIEQSKEFQELNNIEGKESEISIKIEKIEDKLFIFFARLKDSLSDLADLNSDYEILEVIKELELLQEEPLLFFDENIKEKVMPLLNWILAKLTSDELKTPEDDQNPFNELYQELVSEEMSKKEEEYKMLNQQRIDLPKRKMQHPLYSNAQNLRYRRDHYIASEEKLRNEERKVKDKLGHALAKAMQYKEKFESFARDYFKAEIEIEIR